MVIQGRLEWIARHIAAGSDVRISMTHHPGKHATRVRVWMHAGAAGSKHSSVQRELLRHLRTIADSCHASDKGHKHSNGASQVTMWFYGSRSGCDDADVDRNPAADLGFPQVHERRSHLDDPVRAHHYVDELGLAGTWAPLVVRSYPVVRPHLNIPLNRSGSKLLWDRIHAKFKPGADFYARIVAIFDSQVLPCLLSTVRELLNAPSIDMSYEEIVQHFLSYVEAIFNKDAPDVLVYEYKGHFVRQLCNREAFNQALCLRSLCRR
eukprot:TRINITY_DN111545_c0_g1_i1.p1 TRINITY_DN111545_c0_g1~~TRINITY_DN111545_c0_g1_i1.p1  ORF type:complete len:265 (+),score=12.37 TRINITY_DN111545_c0_g1_i1:102-896(+)